MGVDPIELSAAGDALLGSIFLLQISQVTGRILFMLFSLWYLNRWHGVEVKGVWTGMFSLFGIFSVFSNMGFEVWLSRATAANEVSPKRAIGLLFRLKGAGWLISFIVGLYTLLLRSFLSGPGSSFCRCACF